MPRVRLLLCLLALLPAGGLRAQSAADTAAFGDHCAACHGADGRARTPQGRKVKAKDLRESRLDAEGIRRQAREGSRNKSGVSVMPAFTPKDLPDEELESVIRVVLSFRPPAK